MAIVLTSCSLGSVYTNENTGLVNSIKKYAGDVKFIMGHCDNFKTLGDNIKIVDNDGQCDEITLFSNQKIEFDPFEIACESWIRRCLVKPMWLKRITAKIHPEDMLVWIDSDARVRGSITDLENIFDKTKTVAAVHRYDEWLAGFIAFSKFNDGLEFIEEWSRMVIDDYCINGVVTKPDQEYFNELIENASFNACYNIAQDLTEKYGSIAPLMGSKNQPTLVYPKKEALIWHWQASRKDKGWDWPPAERLRDF